MNNKATITFDKNDLEAIITVGLKKTVTFPDGVEAGLEFAVNEGVKSCKTTLYYGFCGVADIVDYGKDILKNKKINYCGDSYSIAIAQ